MYGQTTFGSTVRGGRTSYAHHRGTHSTRSGQTIVYPACATKQEALQCVLYVHDNATRILAAGGDALVMHSCVATLRDIIAGNGGGRGVFALDVKAKNVSGAKAYLPGFCIILHEDHHYTHVFGAQHVEPTDAYQAQFYWHEGGGRLTLDPVSKRTADSSSRRSVSHPFAYHGLSYLLERVFRAWQSLRPRNAPTSGPRQSGQGPSL